MDFPSSYKLLKLSAVRQGSSSSSRRLVCMLVTVVERERVGGSEWQREIESVNEARTKTLYPVREKHSRVVGVAA